jgi:hypothetical protein
MDANPDSRANSLDGLLVPFRPRLSMSSSPLATLAFAAPLDDASSSTAPVPARAKDFGFLPIPKRLRFDEADPPCFGWVLNVTFGLASTLRMCLLRPRDVIAHAFGRI